MPKKVPGGHGDTVEKGLGPRPLGPIGPMVQGPGGPYAAMQLLAAMQLRGSGTGPGQATGCMAAYGPYGPQAPWTMGPMGPRGLGPKLKNNLLSATVPLGTRGVFLMRKPIANCQLLITS